MKENYQSKKDYFFRRFFCLSLTVNSRHLSLRWRIVTRANRAVVVAAAGLGGHRHGRHVDAGRLEMGEGGDGEGERGKKSEITQCRTRSTLVSYSSCLDRTHADALIVRVDA